MSSVGRSTSPGDDSGFAGGLSDPTTAHFRHRRDVLDIVNRLHSYGLHHQLDLPQIAVVGSQSVGKSSLIESISGITLPRAKGTCTRCPIECRLSRMETDWACDVYLRFARQTQEIQFGPRITSKLEVEERIRRAQLAILNPSKSSNDYLLLSTPTPDQNELSFSKDLISVRISGKDVDDLSFVDLPGIIQSVRDGGREADIGEVTDLVSSFIKKPSCLILLVVSCETDLENQGARRLAKQVDPSGDRTIPVLTKPDRIAAGEHSTWMKLLENQQEHFEHGWHCVKQANQTQLDAGISWEEARRNEIDFFETITPWSSLEETIRSRLGTKFLTQALGTILFELICSRLPGLHKEVTEKLRIIQEHMDSLPLMPEGDPVAAVWKLLAGFEKDVTLLVSGRPEDGVKGLLQIFRKSREQFREAIFKQAPDFKPYNRPSSGSGANMTEPFDHTQGRERLEPTGPRSADTVIYLDEVLDMATNAITRELPHNYPYAVKKHYVTRFTQNWPVPARNMFDKMEREFSKELRDLVKQHFSAFSAGGLEGRVLRTVLTQLKTCGEVTQERMRDCMALESEEPGTSNEHYLADYKDKFIARYRATRRLHSQHNPALKKLMDGQWQNTSTMREALQNLQAMGLSGVDHNSLLRLINPDIAEDAIEIMAEVRAYYQVAFKRFVDYIPMILDFQLLKGFDRTLHDALFKGLSLEDDTRERCTRYLEEDPITEQRRKSLRQDLERFKAALDDLQNIPGISLDGYESEDNETQSEGPQIVESDHEEPLRNVSSSDYLEIVEQEVPYEGIILSPVARVSRPVAPPQTPSYTPRAWYSNN